MTKRGSARDTVSARDRQSLSALALVAVVACGAPGATPPTAPVAVDVAPAAPLTSGPLAQSPPPDPTRPPREEEAAGVDENAPKLGPSSSPSSSPAGGKPFDRGAAAAALSAAQIQRCLVPGGPMGAGHVTVVWDPSGRVASVSIDQGPFGGTPVGTCLARVYSTATIPPFAGAPVRVAKSFLLQ